MTVNGESLEQVVDRALVRIADEDGATLGTGFLVTPLGIVFTCDHVVGARERVVLHYADGTNATFGGPTAVIGRHPAVDIAIFGGDVSWDRPALPLEPAEDPPKQFWTKGFQFQQRGLTTAVPVRGDITGHTSISYAGADRSYSVNVLVLNQGHLDEGLSGAPLVDPESGAVFGIVVAHFPTSTDIRGFAVSLGSAARLDSRVRWIIDLNNQDCPRFGPRPNALGARRVCRVQVQHAVERLEFERLYLRDLYTPRMVLTEALERFAAGSTRIFPVFGPAGVGKTTFLAHQADALSQTTTALLLRGLDITSTQESIADLIDAAVAGMREHDWRTQPHASELAMAAQKQPSDLWLLLDALNEHRADMRHLVDVWLPRTIDWVRGRNVRLLFTCRNELWLMIAQKLPKSLVFRSDEGPQSTRESRVAEATTGTRLAEFTETEAREAMRTYGLSGVRHMDLATLPLAVRLMWELMLERPAAAPETLQPSTSEVGILIDRLVTRICERVAVTRGVQSARRIRQFVDGIATEMWRTGTDEIASHALQATFPSAGDWLDALVDEHLLITTKIGYRFAFDEVADYLQSAFIDLSDPTPALFAKAAVSRSWSTVSHAFGRLAAAGIAGTLRAAVGRLNSWMETQRTYETGTVLLAFDVARRISGHPASESSISDIVTTAGAVDRDTTVFLLVENAGQLAIGIDTLLALARALLPGEGSYRWRSKDWTDRFRRSSAVFADEWSVAGIVGKAMEKDSTRTVATLFDWVGDSTNLGGDQEATVHDFACACLFYAGPIAFDQICEGAAERITQRHMADLLLALAGAHWERLRQHVTRWIDLPDSQLAAAELLLRAYYVTESGISRHEIVPMLLRLLETAVRQDVRHSVAGALANEPEVAERVWPLLLSGYLSDEGVSAYTMTRYLPSHLTELAPVFKARVAAATDDAWGSNGEAWKIVSALGSYARDPETLEFTCDLLEGALSTRSAPTVARALEQIMYRIDAAVVESTGLLALCSRVIDVSRHQAPIDCLLDVAYPNRAKDYPSSPLLRRTFERSTIDAARFGNICVRIADVASGRGDEAFAWLHAYLERVGQPAWDSAIINTIRPRRKEFAACAERYWQGVPAHDLTPIVLAYLRARESGLDPSYAAREALSSTGTSEEDSQD